MTTIKIEVWGLYKFAYRQTVKTNGNKITLKIPKIKKKKYKKLIKKSGIKKYVIKGV